VIVLDIDGELVLGVEMAPILVKNTDGVEAGIGT
jgi:hypothetical protein